MEASYYKYDLVFKQASGTSRGILKTKETWFIEIKNKAQVGIGECGLFRGLSIDDRPDYEEKLAWVCTNIDRGLAYLLQRTREFPSIQFGLEQAFLSLDSKEPFVLFPSEFTNAKKAIAINGLIWMGDKNFMLKQIQDKLSQGFSCIKMKIGAIDFEAELELLRGIRREFSAKDIELRVDANGAFSVDTAMDKLKRLADFDLHSIEQPIQKGQWEQMASLCEQTPLPIALDEELIGVFDVTKKEELLQTINPHYIILKPSLVGGIQGSQEWITLANERKIGWWITSALESNIGLNAIAQWTFTLQSSVPQGLGTGGLFTNNFPSPLAVRQGHLHYTNKQNWNFNIE